MGKRAVESWLGQVSNITGPEGLGKGVLGSKPLYGGGNMLWEVGCGSG